MPDNPAATFDWTPFFWGWAGSAALLAVLYVVARVQRNANWVDVGWAASLFGLAIAYASIGAGSIAQRLLVGVVGGVWAGRLSLHLLLDRTLGEPEDGRYVYLRAQFGARADLHFAWFFQAQALLAALLALPFLLVAGNPSPTIEALQWAGVGLFGVAKAGEAVADRQLARWRGDSANRGRTCRRGLWRYSRHPNYFCEWLIWCAFAMIASPAPHGGWAWLAPVAMFVFVTRLTGIPYTEMQAVRSRGDDYRRYQRTTNAFFPWFPRESAASAHLPDSAHLPNSAGHLREGESR